MPEPTPTELPEISEALVIRPGDKLIVRVKQGSSAEQVSRLIDDLGHRFPEIEVTVIAAEQLAVVRPEPPLVSVQLTAAGYDGQAIQKAMEQSSMTSDQRRRNA